MSKTTKPEVQQEQKVQTKYERKVEARKQQKAQEAKAAKISKVVGTVVGVVLIVAIAAAIIIPMVNKNAALKDTYVKVGEHEITKLEYDYYYNSTVNNYITTYASILPYMGLDTTVDFADQVYVDEMTWKDMFDEMTIGQITQIKSMVDDANATGFTYDVTESYDSYAASAAEAAEAEGVSTSEYYKASFGSYATAENMAPFIKDSLLAGAYYTDLMEQNAPTQEEVEAYYNENKQYYDKVDFRSFPFVADSITEESTEEEIATAMEELKTKAEAMMEARKAGEDFEELCLENASEDAKTNYEDTETEYSLTEGSTYQSTATVIGDWVYEEGRQENDITVLEDETNHRYYVVEFINRYYDEADDENISNTLASQKVTEYMLAISEDYDVTDVKGDMKYLLIEAAAAEEAEAEE